MKDRIGFGRKSMKLADIRFWITDWMTVEKFFTFVGLVDPSGGVTLVGRNEFATVVAQRPLETNTNKITMTVDTAHLAFIITTFRIKIMTCKWAQTATSTLSDDRINFRCRKERLQGLHQLNCKRQLRVLWTFRGLQVKRKKIFLYVEAVLPIVKVTNKCLHNLQLSC